MGKEILTKIKLKKDFPSMDLPMMRLPLWDYQKASTAFLLVSKRSVEGSCTGAGKTVICLAMISKAVPAEDIQVIFILTIKSAVRQWVEETKRFLDSEFSLMEITGSNSQSERRSLWVRLKGLSNNGSVLVVMNWEMALLDTDYMMGIIENKKCMLILDEVTKLKNPSSQISRVLFRMQEKVERVHGLSATALSNTLIDLYGIFYVVQPSLLKTKSWFKSQYCKTVKITIPGRGFSCLIPVYFPN
jgi:superfamily II DNA or RNA helicase